MKRRQFIKNTVYTSLGFGLLSGMYAWKVEPFWLEFVKVKMNIPNLPENLIGKTLIQISDIHIGNRVDEDYLIDAFKKAQELNPDIVVYTGDFVSYENEDQIDQLNEVFKHVVKGKLGTVGVLGNHDYGDNWAHQDVANAITSCLENSGVEILSNKSKNINGLTITGLDDFWGLNFNPKPVLQSINTSKANLVLCHNPDVCDLDVWNGFNSWILSGHTHGGQCKPPFLKPPILPVQNNKYSSGKIELSSNRTLYINRALGHLFQVRFNVRPEITVFTLEKA
ncbi:MAG: metallophosphoesterase [Flavobacteriales bacterium]